MNEAKPWWLSKGVWGPVITVVSLALQAKGIAVDAQVEPVVDGLLTTLAALGATFGWWGRMDAQAPIDRTRLLPNVKLPTKEKSGPLGNFNGE